MSIIRVGLSETQQFAEGYDVIFGGRRSPAKSKPKAKPKAGKKPAAGRKKPAKKKR